MQGGLLFLLSTPHQPAPACMKPLLSLLFILLPLSLLAAPGDRVVPGTNRPQVTLVWDANDPSEGVTGYQVLERLGTAEPFLYMSVATTTETQFTFPSIASGEHTMVVVAMRGKEISAPSNSVLIPAALTNPQNLRVTVTFTVP